MTAPDDRGPHILLAGLALAVALLLAARVMAHDIYHDWTTEFGTSCCNDKDCRPVRAKVDDEGRHWVEHDGQWIRVEARAHRQLEDRSGRAHACIVGTYVICYSPGGAGI